MADREIPLPRAPAVLTAVPRLAGRGARSVLGSAFGLGGRVARAGIEGADVLITGSRGLESPTGRRVLAALDDTFIAAVELVLERVFADDVVDLALARVERSGVAQRVTERLLDDGTAEQIAQRVLAGPEAERVIASTLRGPLVEEAVSQLLESEALWVLVDEIARSPSVTEAIAHQGTGFFEQVAEGARGRSRKADARVERLAARLSRRRGRSAGNASESDPSLPEPPLP